MPTRKEPTDRSPTAPDPSMASSTQSDPSTHRGLTPEAASTVGELPDSNVDHLSETLDRVSEQLNSEIVEMPNVVELTSLHEQIEQVKKQLRELKKLRLKEKAEGAVIIPYSKMTFALLHDRLGVKTFNEEVEMETFLTVLDKAKKKYRNPAKVERKGTIFKPDKWPHDELRQSLGFIEDHVVLKTESSTRFLVDQWLLTLAQYFYNERSVSEGNFEALILPEFPIITNPRKDGQQAVATVKFGGFVTGLTGVTDYLVLSQHPSRTPAVATQSTVFQMKKKIEEKPEEPASFENDGEEMDGANVLIVEVKSIVTTSLYSHTPQALAECISLLAIDSTRETVPFVLTNGKEWLFGILAKCSTSANAPNPYEAFLSPTFKILTEDIREYKDGDSSPKSANYKTLITTLVTWVKAHSDGLRDIYRDIYAEKDSE